MITGQVFMNTEWTPLPLQRETHLGGVKNDDINNTTPCIPSWRTMMSCNKSGKSIKMFFPSAVVCCQVCILLFQLCQNFTKQVEFIMIAYYKVSEFLQFFASGSGSCMCVPNKSAALGSQSERKHVRAKYT